MLEQFIAFVNKEKLFTKDSRVLLTVSGGVDSAVMADLFYKAKFLFGIAHCNFKLRNEESEGDEQFVRTLAEKYKVPFYRKTFNTKSYSEKKKISIQMAARDLRYEWLKRLVKDKNYDFIATAHHLDDSIETFFINILRGTGIAGLSGVPVKQGNIIRPLLFSTKKMIREYAEENNLKWREDSSNFTDKYLRNSIRHHLIPSLKKLNESFEKTITKELSYFKEAGDIFKKFIDEKKKEIIEEDGKTILLSIKKLKESGHAETVLHEILRAYDFTPETTELIAQRMYTTAGKKFFSPTYRLIKDRDFFILTPKQPVQNTPSQQLLASSFKSNKFFLKKNQKELKVEDFRLIANITDNYEKKEGSSNIAYIDLAKLNFPVTIRKWRHGDFFYPLGMKGKKKLSDFFIDIKLPLNNKEDIWLFESGNNIVWIIGLRLDDRFKITPKTKKIFRIEKVTSP